MEITVNLYGDARKFGKRQSFALRVPGGTSVQDVLHFLKVPPEEPLAVVINGVHLDGTYQFSSEDVLSLFSMGAFSVAEETE